VSESDHVLSSVRPQHDDSVTAAGTDCFSRRPAARHAEAIVAAALSRA